MFESKIVRLFSGAVSVTGRPDDGYFQNADQHARELYSLAALATRRAGNDLILDVGGNIGLSCMTLALACPNNQVIVFEPSPRSAELIRKNLDNNKIGNVLVVQAAVSDTSGTLNLNEPPTSGFSHIVTDAHLGGNQGMTTEVPVVIMDEFINDKVSFVKIDVEGHEPNVLAGMAKTIECSQPLIYMEFNPWCLTAFGGYNIGAIARGLFESFEIFCADEDGNIDEIGTNPIGFVYKSLVEQNFIDIVIKLRSGKRVPNLEELTLPRDIYKELLDLRSRVR